MGSERAFNQVKAILGKLDRSIDQARARRLGEPDPAEPRLAVGESPAPASEAAARPAPLGPGTLIGKSEREPSPFGRARPIPYRGS